MKRQARFWTDHKGDLVKLKLNAGQTLSHSWGGPTDEGYSWAGCTYSFDGQTVTCEWGTDATDCDGRMRRSGEASCNVTQLAAGYREGNIAFPAWKHDEQSQRDYSAEAMGY